KKMLEIATNFHKDLQNADPHGLETAEYDEACQEILRNLDPKLNETDRAEMDRKFEQEEINEAIKEVPNSKAPGLDGIPIELIKEIRDRHERTKNTENETLNIT